MKRRKAPVLTASSRHASARSRLGAKRRRPLVAQAGRRGEHGLPVTHEAPPGSGHGGIKRLEWRAPTSSLADELTRSRNSFSETVESIRNLIAPGIKVRTNTVATSLNVKSTPELVILLADLGADIIRISQYGFSAYADGGDTLFVEPAEMQRAHDAVRKIAEQYPLLDIFVPRGAPRAASEEERTRAWQNRAVCSAGRYGFVVLSDGKVVLCDELPPSGFWIVGDLSRQSIMDVWNSPHIDALLRPRRSSFKETACFRCEQFDSCHENKGRCFRDAWKAFGTFNAPAPSCPKAPASRRLM